MDSKLKCVFDYVEEGEAKHVENVGANVSVEVDIGQYTLLCHESV